MSWEDDQDEEFDDYADEVDDDPSGDLLPCPSCGRPIYDDTDQCPHCGDWVMPLATAARSSHPWFRWTALGLVLIMLAVWGFRCL